MKLLTVRSPLSSETVVCLLLPTSWSLLGLTSASQPAERVLDLPDGQTSALACLILTVSSLVFQAKAALICSVSLQVTSSNPVYTRYTYLTSKKVRESLNLTETKHRVITKNTSAFSIWLILHEMITLSVLNTSEYDYDYSPNWIRSSLVLLIGVNKNNWVPLMCLSNK